MGLDMYLFGKKYLYWQHEGQPVTEDGFPLKEKKLELGYWRKHPDLHGYIVEKYADGDDNCEEIELGITEIEDIIDAIKTKRLPKTSGFFFGESTPDRDPESLEILEKALEWLRVGKQEKLGQTESRWIVYQASW
jgi:hypothetical protein